MRADYTIDCDSDDYKTFMPVVVLVLFAYIISLPGLISYYLYKHRNELYSTSVYQRVGWLYDPFVRGAEFWQVHDVLMKMILTGMLIYVPPISRAGIAVLVCVIAIANLNYFQPHKNKVLFWLTQLSFITTTAKYVISLLLSSSDASDASDSDEHFTMSILLITLDVFFMSSSVLAIVVSIYVLSARVKQINRDEKAEQKNVRVAASSFNNTKVTPSCLVTTGKGQAADQLKVAELSAVRNKYGASSPEYKKAIQVLQNATAS